MEDMNLASLINNTDKLDTTEIENYSNKAKARIDNEYSWKKIIEDYEKILRK